MEKERRNPTSGILRLYGDLGTDQPSSAPQVEPWWLWKGEETQTGRQWLQTAGSSRGTGGSPLNQCECFPGWSFRAEARGDGKSEKEFDKAAWGGLESRDGDRKDMAPSARVRCAKGTESRGRQCLRSLSQGHLRRSRRGFK